MILVFNPDSGMVLQCIKAPDSHAQYYGDDVLIVEDESITDMTHYVDGGVLVPFPPRPTEHHEWDWVAKAWGSNLPGAKSARKIAVDSERAMRTNAPLLYDGKRLDADTRARENLKSKLEEIKAREVLLQPMPTEMLVWRDADNITHTWATQEAYKAWLEGFTIAMSERGTLLYAAAWQHKANIAALTDIDTILAYDTTAGW